VTRDVDLKVLLRVIREAVQRYLATVLWYAEPVKAAYGVQEPLMNVSR